MSFKFQGEKSAVHIQELFAKLEEGDEFQVSRNKKAKVLRTTKKSFKDFKFASDKAKETAGDIKMNEVIKFEITGEPKPVTLKYMFGAYYSASNKKSDKGAQLVRDMEGMLLVDSLEQLNPFHQKSEILQLMEKRLV
jgi:hypothetical protein